MMFHHDTSMWPTIDEIFVWYIMLICHHNLSNAEQNTTSEPNTEHNITGPKRRTPNTPKHNAEHVQKPNTKHNNLPRTKTSNEHKTHQRQLDKMEPNKTNKNQNSKV